MKGVFLLYSDYFYRDGRYYVRDGRGFFVPFVLGGLLVGAAVGVSRPRPVVVNPYPPYAQGPYYGPPFYY